MSDHGNYFEKVDIENDVLGTVLLKYKNQGVFDEVVDIHPSIDYLLIMDQIDDQKYTFSYFRKREVQENRDIDAPHNLFEVLPALLRIISQTVVLNEEMFASLKQELNDIQEKIVESYTWVQWQTYASEAEVGCGVCTVESYNYNPHGGSAYNKATEWSEQDRYQDAEETANGFVNERVQQKKKLYCKEASKKILNAKFIDNTNKEYKRKRDIQEAWMYLKSQEGQNYLESATAYKRECLKQQIEDNGGDTCPIQYLELSVRTYNCLCKNGITTIGDLKKKTLSDLTKIRNLGRKSFDEILYKMSDIGIELDE